MLICIGKTLSGATYKDEYNTTGCFIRQQANRGCTLHRSKRI